MQANRSPGKNSHLICGGFGIGSGAGAGAGLGGVGSGGSGIGPGPGGTGLGGAGEGGGGTGSGLGIGEGDGAGMVAVNAVRKFVEQALMFMSLVPRPEVTYILSKDSGRRRCPDVFGLLLKLTPECGKLGLESGQGGFQRIHLSFQCGEPFGAPVPFTGSALRNGCR